MPLTAKGKKIMAALKKRYGNEKGKEIFYKMKSEKSIVGVDPETSRGIEKSLTTKKKTMPKRMKKRAKKTLKKKKARRRAKRRAKK